MSDIHSRLSNAQFHRVAAASFHDIAPSETTPEIEIEAPIDEDGYARLTLGEWNLEYFDSESPMFLRLNDGTLLLYQSDIDTIMALLTRARAMMQGGG